jgi:hypothetical protein
MKLFPSIILTLITTLSFGQRVEVTLGPVLDPKQIRNDVKLPRIAFGGSYSTTLFFNPVEKKTYTGFGFKDKAFHFAVLDNYLNYSGVKKLAAETINERVTLNSFIIVNNKMFVLYSMKFPDQDGFSVYVNEVSDDMVILGSPIILHNFKDLKAYGMNISVYISRDKQHLLINRLYETRPKEKQKMDCKVINNSFSEVWFKTIEMQNFDKELKVRSVDVDNSGNFYCLVEPNIRKVTQPTIYSYFWKTKSQKAFTAGLTTGDNFGTKLELLNGETPYVVGLNESDKKVTYFVHRIDKQAEALVSLGSSVMPGDFYKDSNFRGFETDDWSVTDVVSLENNTVVASIEASTYSSSTKVFYSYNAYILGLREDGSQAWARTIYKKQGVTLDGTYGHVLIPAKDNVLIIYNDNEDNISKKPEDPKVDIFRTKDPMVVVQEIDPAGKVSKYPLSKNPSMKGYALFFNMMGKIDKGLYYATGMKINGLFSIDSRNMTLLIK